MLYLDDSLPEFKVGDLVMLTRKVVASHGLHDLQGCVMLILETHSHPRSYEGFGSLVDLLEPDGVLFAKVNSAHLQLIRMRP